MRISLKKNWSFYVCEDLLNIFSGEIFKNVTVKEASKNYFFILLTLLYCSKTLKIWLDINNFIVNWYQS